MTSDTLPKDASRWQRHSINVSLCTTNEWNCFNIYMTCLHYLNRTVRFLKKLFKPRQSIYWLVMHDSSSRSTRSPAQACHEPVARRKVTPRKRADSDDNIVWLLLWVDLREWIKLMAVLALWENTHRSGFSFGSPVFCLSNMSLSTKTNKSNSCSRQPRPNRSNERITPGVSRWRLCARWVWRWVPRWLKIQSSLCEWVTHKLLSVKRLEFPITLRDWQGLIFAETWKDRPSIIFKADKSDIRSDFFCQLASGFLSVWWVFACCVFLPRRDAIANCFSNLLLIGNCHSTLVLCGSINANLISNSKPSSLLLPFLLRSVQRSVGHSVLRATVGKSF